MKKNQAKVNKCNEYVSPDGDVTIAHHGTRVVIAVMHGCVYAGGVIDTSFLLEVADHIRRELPSPDARIGGAAGDTPGSKRKDGRHSVAK